MTIRSIRILMNGVTGRLGQNQHLVNSVLAIRNEGGLALSNGDTLMPEPVLAGRNADKLAALAARYGDLTWTTDIEEALADDSIDIYFDVALTAGRVERARQALAAGKHIYLEKPIADTLEDAMALAREAQAAGLKNGVVQDKVYLPGFQKLRKLRDTGFFGRILSARLDFGWWVFDGEMYPAQRSSWNYKKAEGGGLILDMFPHWRYIVDQLLGELRAVSCRAITRVPQRRDEAGRRYDVDVEDDVFAAFELENDILVHVSSSWTTRVRGDDMLTLKIDGTDGSAITTLHDCFLQSMAMTPKPAWNVDVRQHNDFDAHWHAMPDVDGYMNSYRCGWERFLRHVAEDAPFPSPLLAGVKGLQLVQACHQSNHERRWIELPALTL